MQLAPRKLAADRSKDRFSQAARDLEQAGASRRDGRHECAWFAAQQAAEKAMKALHLSLGQAAWGHVAARLMQNLPLVAPEELVEKAKVLDHFYVATRSANGHPEGAPFEPYGRLQRDEAIAHASEIIAFARAHMAGS